MSGHRRRIAALGMILLSGAAAGQEEPASLRKTSRLEQEYAIAKTSASYFIFDFEARTVALKARGFVLKEWPIAKVRTWGRIPGGKAFPLEKKSAIHQPQRKDITPRKDGAESEPAKTAAAIDVLEIDKMPSHFTLELPDEIRIKVRPDKKGWKGFWSGIGRIFSRGIGRSAKTVFRAVRKKPFTEIEIFFAEKKDAQGVYWSFFEGQKCLLFF